MKVRRIAMAVVLLTALVFGEYRFIMCHIEPMIINEHCVRIEFLGFVDEYYCDDLVPILDADTSIVRH